MPASGSLTLKLQAQLYSDITNTIYTYFPTRPTVIFGSGNQEDVEDFDLDSPFLSEEREGTVYLAESLVSGQGFGNLTVVNEGGDIILPESVILTPRTGSQFSLTAANIDVLGRIVSPGSILSFKALNLTSYDEALDIEFTPPPNPGRGVLTLGASALLNTAGLVTDGRVPVRGRFDPIVLEGGQVNLIGYSADLRAGAQVNVSGGYVLTSAGKGKFGDGGSITIEAGVNPGAKALGGCSNNGVAVDRIFRKQGRQPQYSGTSYSDRRNGHGSGHAGSKPRIFQPGRIRHIQTHRSRRGQPSGRAGDSRNADFACGEKFRNGTGPVLQGGSGTARVSGHRWQAHAC